MICSGFYAGEYVSAVCRIATTPYRQFPRPYLAGPLGQPPGEVMNPSRSSRGREARTRHVEEPCNVTFCTVVGAHSLGGTESYAVYRMKSMVSPTGSPLP
ncbi:hypothetical protein BD309DRAFT_964982 [Dichomitus squalens]|nr:hypothetical protein BD309DRAFT_964982 [Dichomitus squalens]